MTMTFDAGDSTFYGNGVGPHSMLWADETSGRQTVETQVENFGQTTATDYLTVVLRHCGGDPDCGLRFTIARTGSPDLWTWTVNWIDAGGGTVDFTTAPAAAAWAFGDPFTIRGESEVDGSYRFMVNNTVVIQKSVATVPISPSRVGFEIDSQVGGVSVSTDILSSSHLGAGDNGICLDDVSFTDDFLCTPLTVDPVEPDVADGSVWIPAGLGFLHSQFDFNSPPRMFEGSALMGFTSALPKLYLRTIADIDPGATAKFLPLALIYRTLTNPLASWLVPEAPKLINVSGAADRLMVVPWLPILVSNSIPTVFRISRQTGSPWTGATTVTNNDYQALGLLLEPV